MAGEAQGEARGRAKAGVALLAFALAMTCGTAPVSAQAGEGLDPAFGKRGKVMTAIGGGNAGDNLGPMLMASAPGGRIVAAGGRTVVRYLPNGDLDPGFGRRGRRSIETAEGARFDLAAIAVDSKGRLLLAGTTFPASPPTPPEYDGPGPTAATVIRYLRSGELDLNFGGSGAITTDFGLPAPKRQEVPGEPASTYATSSVEVSGLAVDSSDRLLVTGSSIASVTQCYPFLSFSGISRAYLARLSSDGTLDHDFHGTGVLAEAGLATAAQPRSTGSGGIVYVGDRSAQCLRGSGGSPRLAGLSGDGNPDAGFGSDGFVDLPYFFAPAMAVDRFGRILLVGGTEESYEPDNEYRMLMRLSPRGVPDADFGSNGTVRIDLPRYGGQAALAVDERGRTLLATSARHSPRATRFSLTRRRQDGGVDRRFGHRGWVNTGFGASAKAEGEAVLVDPRGRIVVGGVISSPRLPSGHGFALARYRAGR